MADTPDAQPGGGFPAGSPSPSQAAGDFPIGSPSSTHQTSGDPAAGLPDPIDPAMANKNEKVYGLLLVKDKKIIVKSPAIGHRPDPNDYDCADDIKKYTDALSAYSHRMRRVADYNELFCNNLTWASHAGEVSLVEYNTTDGFVKFEFDLPVNVKAKYMQNLRAPPSAASQRAGRPKAPYPNDWEYEPLTSEGRDPVGGFQNRDNKVGKASNNTTKRKRAAPAKKGPKNEDDGNDEAENAGNPKPAKARKPRSRKKNAATGVDGGQTGGPGQSVNYGQDGNEMGYPPNANPYVNSMGFGGATTAYNPGLAFGNMNSFGGAPQTYDSFGTQGLHGGGFQSAYPDLPGGDIGGSNDVDPQPDLDPRLPGMGAANTGGIAPYLYQPNMGNTGPSTTGDADAPREPFGPNAFLRDV